MWKINGRFIFKILGIMCLIESVFVLLTVAVALIYREDVMPYFSTAMCMVIAGGLFILMGKKTDESNVSTREGMLTVTLTWITLSLFGMIPFLLSGVTDNVTDAFFETMSGFTTTGATMFPQVSFFPKALLFWRSIIQWQGGVGIVVFTVALLPLFNGGQASHLFNSESTGITHDRFLPRITEVAKRLWGVYIAITLVLIVLLLIGPMNLFESVCHAFTCVASGGYSTKDNSIADFNSPYTEYVLSAFMFISALNITLLYFSFTGKPSKLFKDEEFRTYGIFVTICIVICTLWLCRLNMYDTFESKFRHALFQVMTFASSTGYTTADINLWQPFFWMMAIVMMSINGCAGSTCGGIKTGRFLILIRNLGNEFKKRTHPNLVVLVKLNGHQIQNSVVHQVIAFIFLYISLMITGAMIMMFDGSLFADSIGAAAACISNSGPGVGAYMANMASAGVLSKWVLSFLMLAGRLEVFTVMSILSTSFWRR
ncbi:TrkH family potassium uptake protein [Porphyromonas pogonae]|uniref:TrkH family potassium uptake protein n=1 Tax=Porphyromonas pogonae TaxID=867595 RepID=UPI002E79B0B2|nr:TrkH family potassium uptake protein [Porphyromonas pogonae]